MRNDNGRITCGNTQKVIDSLYLVCGLGAGHEGLHFDKVHLASWDEKISAVLWKAEAPNAE
jgi:hypothetical protein